MNNWKERILELTPEEFLKLAGIEMEEFNREVTDNYMESNNVAFSSIGSLIELGVNNFLYNNDENKGLFLIASTEFVGNGEYITNIEFPADNGVKTYIQIFTKSENFIDFTNELIEVFRKTFGVPIIDTVRFQNDEVINMRQILGDQVTTDEVQTMQEFLNSYDCSKKILKLIYENVIKENK